MGIQSYEMEEKQNIVHTLVGGTKNKIIRKTNKTATKMVENSFGFYFIFYFSFKKERQRKTLKQYNEHTYNFHGNFLIRLCMFVLPKFPFDAFLLIHFDCDIYKYIYMYKNICLIQNMLRKKFMGEYTINYLFNVYFYIHFLSVAFTWLILLWFNNKTFCVFVYGKKKLQLVC